MLKYANGVFLGRNFLFFLFVSLFVSNFTSHSRKYFPHMWICYHINVLYVNMLCEGVTITGEGHQILIYTRRSWPLSIEVSLWLTGHIYYDTRHPFILLPSKTRDTCICCQPFWQWICIFAGQMTEVSWLWGEHLDRSQRRHWINVSLLNLPNYFWRNN